LSGLPTTKKKYNWLFLLVGQKLPVMP